MRKLMSAVAALTLLALILVATPSSAGEPPECDSVYVVQTVDSLSRLAQRFYGDWSAYPAIDLATDAAAAADETYTTISDPNLIHKGSVLCIPSADEALASLTWKALGNAEYKTEWTRSGVAELTDGRFSMEAAPGSASKIVITLHHLMAFGYLADGRPVAAVIMISSGGGSGTFYELAVVSQQDGKLVNLATTQLGDRARIKRLSMENGEFIVDMVTQSREDAMCCPTRRVVRGYSLIGEELVQTSSRLVTAGGGTTSDFVALDMGDLRLPYQAYVINATPYDISQPPGPKGLPEHILVTFGSVDADELGPFDPRLYIIPIPDYVHLWETNGNEGVTRMVDRLRDLLTDRPLALPNRGVPVLPYEAVVGVNDLAVQGKYLDFPAGSGVRFVGRFAQDPNPVTNQRLTYMFQGFSSDGRYLISLFWPVTSSALPDSAGDVSEEEMERVNQEILAYLEERAEALNALKPSDWSPDLDQLDAMVESLGLPRPLGGATPEIVGPIWKWERFLGGDDSTIVVDDPEKFTLELVADADLSIRSDCNRGSGVYTVDGSLLSIDIQTTTLAQCEEGSLYDEYIKKLNAAVSYVMDDGKLAIALIYDSGIMIFGR